MLRNVKNKIGQNETYRMLSYRHSVHGRIKEIDEKKGVVYFEEIFFDDLDNVSNTEYIFVGPENYIYNNKTLKKMNIKEGEWISFRGTLMNYSVAKDEYGTVCEGLSRLVNIRNIKRIEVK